MNIHMLFLIDIYDHRQVAYRSVKQHFANFVVKYHMNISSSILFLFRDSLLPPLLSLLFVLSKYMQRLILTNSKITNKASMFIRIQVHNVLERYIASNAPLIYFLS